MSTPASPGALSGLAALVSDEAINGLLLQRGPDGLFDGDAAEMLKGIKRGVGSEVEQITGGVPTDEGVLALALWAVTLGVAANVEDSLFPEQQQGDASRASRLQTRYLGVRAQLAEAVADSDTTVANGTTASFDGFGAPAAWPMPATAPYGYGWTGYGGTERGWIP